MQMASDILFLHLGAHARSQLLEFCIPTRLSNVADTWKTGSVLSILCTDKSPLELAFFPAIAVVRCVGKVMNIVTHARNQ